ncbi:MAG: c-type cytochrome [Kofleriaceae bacterium]|nr:c-type cytochrome [Kofleriaceae bacterium]
MTHARSILSVAAALIAVAACHRDDDRPARPDAPAPAAAVDPGPAATATPAAVDPAVLARGDYLVNVVMNCGGCHTPMTADGRPDDARRLAGGLEVREPFGTWRSPNITQDRRTGIGDWTDAEIAAAIREGVRPSGDRLYPIMPYTFYRDLADDDVAAIVAYLRTVPAVTHAVAGNTELALPRPALPPPSGRAPAATPAARGAYLASLMTCGHCHTPLDATGAPDRTRPMAGGMAFDLPPFLGTGQVFAANLTSDPETGLGRRSDDELARAITALVKHDGTPVVGPMALMGARWSTLRPDDVAALVAYLRTVPPVVNHVPPSTFVPAAAPPAPAAGPGDGPTR